MKIFKKEINFKKEKIIFKFNINFQKKKIIFSKICYIILYFGKH